MGHRFSKTTAHNIAADTTTTSENKFSATTTATTNIIPIPFNGNQKTQFGGPAINLQKQNNPTTCSGSGNSYNNLCSDNNRITTAGILQQQQNNSISSSLTSANNLSCGRQIVIKIQLAKMENGNEISTSSPSSPPSPSSLSDQQQLQEDTSLEDLPSPADCNRNSPELSTKVTSTGTQFLNLTLNNNSNSMPNPLNTQTTTTAPTPTTSPSLNACASLFGAADSSFNNNNNYLSSNSGGNCSAISSYNMPSLRFERPERLNSLQFNDEIVEQNIGEIVEYCEVLEDQQQPQLQPQPSISNRQSMRMLSFNREPDEINICCRRKSKSLAAIGGCSVFSNNSNTGVKTKTRCRKCSCRDALRRFLDPSLSRSAKKASKQLQQQQQLQQQKEQKLNKSQERHSINNPLIKNINKTYQQQLQRNSMHSINTTTRSSCIAATNASAMVVPPAHGNQMSSWLPTTNAGPGDVNMPLRTPPPQFVLVQCAIGNPSNAAPHPVPNNSANDATVKVPSNDTTTAGAGSTGPIVHSQVDFVHYLVPDLERITNSSFYWGKMDRYEAERLLEGKPEGTFLLRDSAQEEFLFSVTFRKYGRSLHARIEQSDHRFSFDCHDPCVFTAPTVTGLLEHYKDPTCVMFFEPMLTIPLHRTNCFSLQKLCRATIVSNTTYDGITELELPSRLKSYLKEYHYKQKLRVKSNEPTYTIHCK